MIIFIANILGIDIIKKLHKFFSIFKRNINK